jgi:hypothetical protein
MCAVTASSSSDPHAASTVQSPSSLRVSEAGALAASSGGAAPEVLTLAARIAATVESSTNPRYASAQPIACRCHGMAGSTRRGYPSRAARDARFERANSRYGGAAPGRRTSQAWSSGPVLARRMYGSPIVVARMLSTPIIGSASTPGREPAPRSRVRAARLRTSAPT